VIIVVSPEATPADLDHIVARIEETGRSAHVSVGTERSIIGVIGPDAPGSTLNMAQREVELSRNAA